ncbi:MAG: OsmC family protein [Nocardioides sp.]|jgi:uncharacterized OsmC-like protein
MTDRTVHTRWTGGMRAVSDVGGFEIVVDEPESAGGTDTGPQPTDLLLVSIGSCIALSMAFVARKRDIELLGLTVSVVGSYEGTRFADIAVSISSDSPREVLEALIPEAERVCYVSNTLRHQPNLVIDIR